MVPRGSWYIRSMFHCPHRLLWIRFLFGLFWGCNPNHLDGRYRIEGLLAPEKDAAFGSAREGFLFNAAWYLVTSSDDGAAGFFVTGSFACWNGQPLPFTHPDGETHNGVEEPYQAPTTVLTVKANKGDVKIEVTDPDSQVIQESLIYLVQGKGSLVLERPLCRDFPAGTPVRLWGDISPESLSIPFTQ